MNRTCQKNWAPPPPPRPRPAPRPPPPRPAGARAAPAAPAAPASAPRSASQLAPIHGPYHPRIDRRDFVRRVDNRFLPFLPGARLHSGGVSGRTPRADDEVVLQRTKRILGIRSTVVRDEVSEHGTVVERTFDYYAQDRQDNVWYMGELALERHHGRLVKASDSWRSGVKGARPGIIMPGRPRRGDAYR